MNSTEFKNDWEVKSNDFSLVGFDIAGYIRHIAKEQMPEYLEFFPYSSFKCDSFANEDFVIIRLENLIGQIPITGKINDDKLIALSKSIFLENSFPDFNYCLTILQGQGYTYDIFTYIGKCEGNKLCWLHICQNLIEWLNKFVLPNILKLNEKRVMAAIPTPPKFDTVSLFENIYVLESESSAIQGTVFHLKDIGLITCDHCIRNSETGKLIEDLVIYKGYDLTKKIKAKVFDFNQNIDIAILTIDDDFLNQGLEMGASDNLKQLDHIAVAGFPNYNFGDNGYFSPGLIVGFRTYSGFRHILVNVALVSGNSGGPAFDKDSKVIGIAVTGADKFSTALETEKHGLIPIEAINFLKSNSK